MLEKLSWELPEKSPTTLRWLSRWTSRSILSGTPGRISRINSYRKTPSGYEGEFSEENTGKSGRTSKRILWETREEIPKLTRGEIPRVTPAGISWGSPPKGILHGTPRGIIQRGISIEVLQ